MRTNLKTLFRSVSLAVAMALPLAVSGNDDDKKATHSPKEFIKGALDASQMELKAGELAQQKAQNAKVKELGERMVEDHQKIESKLKELAQKHNVQATQGLQQDHKEEWQKLESASGAEFDKAFLQHTIRDHQEDLAMLEKSAKQFSNEPELQALIQEHLPDVRQHLQLAKNAASEIGLDVSQITSTQQQPASAAGAAAGTEVGEDEQKKPEGSEESKTQDEDPNLSREEVTNEDDEILGLPTSNTDGTILGVFPAPSREVEAGSKERIIAEELKDGKVDPGVESIEDEDAKLDAVVVPPFEETDEK